MKVSLVEGNVPGSDEVRVEAGETVPGRTDGQVGEVNLSDGPGLYGGGDGTVSPAGEWLVDQDPGTSEARDDDSEPEQSDKTSGCRNINQTVNGGGGEEFLHSVHSEELESTILKVENWWVFIGGPEFTAPEQN